MTYTAYDGVNFPRGATASIAADDFLAKRFEKWSEPRLMTPPGVDDKDVAFLPATIDGKYILYHRVNMRICADLLDDLEFKAFASRCTDIFGPRPGMWDGGKVGIAGPPIPVDGAWLMPLPRRFHAFRVPHRCGAPGRQRHARPRPQRRAALRAVMKYELEGEVRNVVFPCGAIVRGDTVFLYYGGADTVVGVATASLSRILAALA